MPVAGRKKHVVNQLRGAPLFRRCVGPKMRAGCRLPLLHLPDDICIIYGYHNEARLLLSDAGAELRCDVHAEVRHRRLVIASGVRDGSPPPSIFIPFFIMRNRGYGAAPHFMLHCGRHF